MEATFSVLLGYELNEQLMRLLEDFGDMVNFRIEEALKCDASDYARFVGIAIDETRMNLRRTRGFYFEKRHSCMFKLVKRKPKLRGCFCCS